MPKLHPEVPNSFLVATWHFQRNTTEQSFHHTLTSPLQRESHTLGLHCKHMFWSWSLSTSLIIIAFHCPELFKSTSRLLFALEKSLNWTELHQPRHSAGKVICTSLDSQLHILGCRLSSSTGRKGLECSVLSRMLFKLNLQ